MLRRAAADAGLDNKMCACPEVLAIIPPASRRGAGHRCNEPAVKAPVSQLVAVWPKNEHDFGVSRRVLVAVRHLVV